MKKKIMAAVMICMLLVSINGAPVHVEAGSAVVRDGWYYDYTTYELVHTDTNQRIKVSDETINRVKDGYQLSVVLADKTVYEGYTSYIFYTFTYPVGVILDYSTNGYDVYFLTHDFQLTRSLGVKCYYSTDSVYVFESGSVADFGWGDYVAGKSSSIGYYNKLDYSSAYDRFRDSALYSDEDLYYYSFTESNYKASETQANAVVDFRGAKSLSYDQSFKEWSEDFGLNLKYSSSEDIQSCIPFYYNEEHCYIVVKDAYSGYRLYHIQNAENLQLRYTGTNDMRTGQLVPYNTSTQEQEYSFVSYYYSVDGWKRFSTIQDSFKLSGTSQGSFPEEIYVDSQSVFLFSSQDVFYGTGVMLMTENAVTGSHLDGVIDISPTPTPRPTATPIPTPGITLTPVNPDGTPVEPTSAPVPTAAPTPGITLTPVDPGSGGTGSGGSSGGSAGSDATLSEQIDNIVAFVSAVPRIIGGIFSFLPEWCLNTVGISFGTIVALIIYKLVRG